MLRNFEEVEMKISIVLVVVSLSLVITKAQKIGGFGYITVGASYLTSTQIESRLKEDALFGSGFSFKQQGTHIGARVLGCFNRFLVGGSGYRSSFIGNTDDGEANLKVLGRFFNVGYFLVSKPKTHLYAFGGFGGIGGSLVITRANEFFSKSLSFSPNQKVIMSEEISQNGVGYEFGIGVQRFISPKNSYDEVKSGFLIGVVAGANLFPSTTWEFKANGTNVTNMGNISSFYIGITIGGGGFSN